MSSERYCRFDVFPRWDVHYCYMCNGKIPLYREEGDKKRQREDPKVQNDCANNFVPLDYIDLQSVICGSAECGSHYQSLPKTRYQEELVIYHKQEQFEGIPFLDFLERQDVNDILQFGPNTGYHPKWWNDSVESLETLLQAWLFFALAEEALGDFFEPQDYIESDKEDLSLLSLRPFAAAVTRWMYSGNSQENFQRVEKVIRIGFFALSQTQLINLNPDLRTFLASAMELISVAIYAHDLEHDQFQALAVFWPMSRVDHLVELGWCPNEANKFAGSIWSLCTRALYANLNRRDIRSLHGNCTKRDCVESREAVQRQLGPKHAADCFDHEDCSLVRVDEMNMSKMESFLNSGEFPVIRIRHDPNGGLQIVDVVPYKNGRSFVAISHVWSHGLGNEQDNSLFDCQLSRVYRYVKQLGSILEQNEPDVFLWLDTLCCPVIGRAGRRARDAALKLMKKTYVAATSVLALDEEWNNLRMSELSPLEVAAHVFSSSWVWRLWTLQEGSLPEELWFQFHDRPLNSHSLFLAIRACLRGRDFRDRRVAGQLLGSFLSLRILCGRYQSLSRTQEVLLTTLGLEKRVVTRRKDEAYCVATLLDLDFGHIIDAQQEHVRMQRLWNLMSVERLIPRDIAFNAVPTLETKGYTWAPATLLTEQAIAISYASPERAIICETGLSLHASGLSIELTKPLDKVEGLYFGTIDQEIEFGGEPRFDHFFRSTFTEGLQFEDNTIIVEVQKGTWAVLYGFQTQNDLLTEVPLKQILQESGKKFALMRKYLSTRFGAEDDGTSILVEETAAQSTNGITCIRRMHVSLKELSLEVSACHCFASQLANDLRANKHFLDALTLEADSKDAALTSGRNGLLDHLQFNERLRSRPEVPEKFRDIAIDEDNFPLHVKAHLSGDYAIAIREYDESQGWCLQ